MSNVIDIDDPDGSTSMTIDDSDVIYDQDHNISGHFDHNTNNIINSSGEIGGYVDHHGEIYDTEHDAVGKWVENSVGGHSFVDTTGQTVMSVNDFGQIFDSAFNILGSIKNIW